MYRLRFLPVLALAAFATSCVTPSSAPVPSSQAPSSLRTSVEAAIEAGNWAIVLPLAQELVKEQPEDARAWGYLGLGHAHAQDNAQAILAFEKSLSLQETAKVHQNLGVCFVLEGKLEQAVPHFERATAMKPDDGLAWKMLAQSQTLLQRWDAAAVAFKHARRLLPEDQELDRVEQALALAPRTPPPPEALAHHARGGELATQGRQEEAEKEYEAALKIAPGFADCHYNLGLLARRRGDLERAEREYRSALDTYHPEETLLSADAMNNLADTLVARGGDASEAVQLAREAISVRGERASYLDTLARACDAQGDTRCAVEAFRKLLASSVPLPPEVRAHAEKRLGALTL